MKVFGLVLAAAATALWASLASAITIADPTDWTSGWVYSTVEVAGTGTASFTVEPAGGNPGARLNSTTVTPTGADTAFGAALYQGVTVAAPLSATSFTMHLDVLSGAGDFGQGQGVQALVSQGGSLYQTSLGITGFPFNSFTTLTFSGTFTSAAFTKISGPGPATPSFDGVTPTNFGFAVGNNMSATLTQYYDNWNISFSAPPAQVVTTAVPALSTGSLLSLTLLVALVSIGVWSRRR